MEIGVLALQGAFIEHASVLKAMGVRTVLVRTAEQLAGLSGLVLPGGESTSMRRLAGLAGLDRALVSFAAARPLWGVCAGLILLAREIEGEEPFLGVMDMRVARNAYGRQQESFVAGLEVRGLDGDFPGVFIRAPRVTGAGESVEILARLGEEPVALRQERILATAFHPELTSDIRMHCLFADMCAAAEAGARPLRATA